MSVPLQLLLIVNVAGVRGVDVAEATVGDAGGEIRKQRDSLEILVDLLKVDR